MPILVALGQGQRAAQGVSLVVVAITALVGAITHYRQGTVQLSTVLWVAPSAIVFGVLGANLAGLVDPLVLRRIFGVVILGAGLMMLLSGAPRFPANE